jgi:hypothetical protein
MLQFKMEDRHAPGGNMKGATIIKVKKANIHSTQSSTLQAGIAHLDFCSCVAQKPNMVQVPGTVLYRAYQKKGAPRNGGTVQGTVMYAHRMLLLDEEVKRMEWTP